MEPICISNQKLNKNVTISGLKGIRRKIYFIPLAKTERFGNRFIQFPYFLVVLSSDSYPHDFPFSVAGTPRVIQTGAGAPLR